MLALTPSIRRCTVAALGVLTLAGCAALTPERNAPPVELYDLAVAANLPDARYWGDDIDERSRVLIEREVRGGMLRAWDHAGRPAEGLDIALLALSGGGPDGAFGAGLLSGWTERGDRPAFHLVTGISVGALIAPFAFVGPDYDRALRTMFTELDTRDVAERQFVRAMFGALGLARTDPLRRQIERFVDDDFLQRIAEGRREGRMLLVGTTNLDAQRGVIWDMGKIAEAGELELFRDVLLASASIPGAFPPVGIEVEAEGRRYTEFHVDGGVATSVFVGPTRAADALPRDLPFPIQRRLFVIMNNSLVVPYRPVENRLREIVARSISGLIRAQADGDLIRMYVAANLAGADFRLTFVPLGFDAPAESAFDRQYMTALFETAREIGRGEIPWWERPPALIGRQRLERVVTRRPDAATGR
ncbi:MAG: hypothetical protein EA356_00910 [Geminicoccaceae bacterium]|nr:MAG: hypothetical protein EA356_00910 [Geminicoccaceae bacterium]